MRPPGCRKTLVGASIARPRPFALQETIPENALLRQVGGRPMVAPTPQQYFTMQQRQTSPERSRPFPSVSKNLPLRNRIPRYGGGGACARGGAVARRAGGREPCHSPKCFGLPLGSLSHRLRAEPPRRGSQEVLGTRIFSGYTNTACTSTIYRAVPTAMLSSVFFFHRCSPTTAAPASSSGRPWVGPSRSTPRRQ